MTFIKSNIYIILILLIGFILRFSISLTHSYSNDELSAINRLNFDNFSDMMENGVKTGDMHPGGIQIFMKFWSSIFGVNEGPMRFPFVIFGVFSIFLTYKIGKKWLNKKSGIIAALLMSVLYFPVINTEFARPYSPGLFFSLLVSYFILNFILEKSKSKKQMWLNSICLGFSFALAMYTHYFAFMFVGFIGFTGFFFLKKDKLIPYTFSALLGISLFLPHIGITLYHLSIDGGLQWLGPPDNSWLFQFLFHVFNESWLIVTIFICFLLFALIKSKQIFQNNKIIIILTTWFLGIYILAHIFSIYSSPILKFPVMLFPVPFLFLIIGHFFSKLETKYFNLIFISLLISISISTIFEKKLYENKHFGLFKEIAAPIVEWEKKYGKENIISFMNVNSTNYLNFYANKLNYNLEFDVDLIEFDGDIHIREKLINTNKDYCIVGYSSRLTLPQVFETVKEFYPNILDYRKYEECAVFLMTKQNTSVYTQNVETIGETFILYETSDQWKLNREYIKGLNTDNLYYLLDSTNIYGPDFIFKKNDIIDYENKYIKIIVSGIIPEDGQLTVSFTATRNGELVYNRGEIYWLGHDLEKMMITTMNSSTFGSSYFAFQIPDFIRDNDEIKISLWNRNGSEIKIYDFKILAVENIWN